MATGAGWITPLAWSPQGDMTTSPSPADSAQPDIPNAARIYSYTLGGTHYFPVDQAAAEYMFSLVPSTPKWVRMLRAFLQHAARQLWAEGFTHFVDFASGLPTEDHSHYIHRGRICDTQHNRRHDIHDRCRNECLPGYAERYRAR